MLKKLGKGLDIFEDTLLIAGLLVATFSLFANVILRFFFEQGLVWSEEVARYAIIWIVCGGCGAAVRTGAHMRITAVLDMSKNEKFKMILNTIVTVISLVFSIFLLVYGVKLTGSMIVNNQLSPALELPLWTVYLSIPVGGFLMTVRYIQLLVKTFKKDEKGEVE